MAADYKELEKNLTDVVKEFQIKIGYSKHSMSLYYMKDSLERLLGITADEKNMEKVLEDFSKYSENIFKGIKTSYKDNRFCITIPAEGVEYIHKTVPDSQFLKLFLSTVTKHDISINDIANVFKKFSENVCCKEIRNDDFDYVIYFTDGIPDEYIYCVKFENCHATYHRFTKKEFDAFGF